MHHTGKSRGAHEQADALAFLHEIEATLYRKTKTEGEPPGKLFEDLETCRDYIGDSGASVKMLLEYVAVITPTDVL